MLPFLGFAHVQKAEGPPTPPLFTQASLAQPASQERFEHVRSCEQHLANGDANPEWLQARTGIVTGSRAANCCQLSYNAIKDFFHRHGLERSTPLDRHLLTRLMLHNREYSPKEVHELVHGVFTGNKFTRWGNEHEDDCEYRFQHEILGDWGWRLAEHRETSHIDVDVQEVIFHHDGLCLSATDGWAGYSPDGRMEQVYADGSTACCLLEFKCPYTKRHSWKTENLYGPLQTLEGEWYPISLYYYVQIHHGMRLLFDRRLLWPRTLPGHCKRCGIEEDTPPGHVCDPTLADHRLKQLFCYFAVWTWPDQERWEFEAIQRQRSHVRCLHCGDFAHKLLHCPTRVVGNVEVSKIPFSKTFSDWLHQRCRDFWSTEFAPALERKHHGMAAVQKKKETPWIGRTLEEKTPLFTFLHACLKKARMTCPPHFVDWGSGTGTMLQSAVADHGFQRAYGIEQDSKMARLAQPSNVHVHEGDIMDAQALPCPPGPAVHFIYDGGLYPKETAQHICHLLKEHGKEDVVLVVTSLFPPNAEGVHFEAKEYASCLRPCYSHSKSKLKLRESSDQPVTMQAHFFYRKKK